MTDPKFTIRRPSLVLGLLYALFPVSIGVGELLWHRDHAAMRWMAVAAGIVFVSVVLAYNQGCEEAGRG